MVSDEYKDQIFSQLQQWLAESKARHRACIDWIESFEHELDLMKTGQMHAGTSRAVYNEQEKFMIANGHRLGVADSTEIVRNNYDVILDLTQDVLRVRICPERHSKLLTYKFEDLRNVGPYRIKLLAYLLEHPGWYVSMENAVICHGMSYEIRSFEALRTAIKFLRQALGTPGPNNPYIKTKRSTLPCSYALNTKWSYLLIKWKTIEQITNKPQYGNPRVTGSSYDRLEKVISVSDFENGN